MTGFHGWVQTYRTEQNGEFEFGTSDADCGVCDYISNILLYAFEM